MIYFDLHKHLFSYEISSRHRLLFPKVIIS